MCLLSQAIASSTGTFKSLKVELFNNMSEEIVKMSEKG
jgi:hypothetical protein